jgi:hypothetical protein
MENLLQRFNKKWEPEPYSGCWLWTAAAGSGDRYGRFMLPPNRLAHRVSWQIYKGKIPNGMCVLHSCDTALCVNPDHLFLGTQAENLEDCRRKKRAKPRRGEHHPHARLTDEAVREIRASPLGARRLARKFGVYPSTIWYVKTQRRWRHVV